MPSGSWDAAPGRASRAGNPPEVLPAGEDAAAAAQRYWGCSEELKRPSVRPRALLSLAKPSGNTPTPGQPVSLHKYPSFLCYSFFLLFSFKWTATAPPTQTQQNIPPPTAVENPSVQPAGAEQPGSEAAEDVNSEKDDVDVFLVESIEVDADDGEMCLSIAATPLQGNSTPWENGGQVGGRRRNGEAKRAELAEDRRELQPSKKAAAPAVEKAAETNPEQPSVRLRDILCASPVRMVRTRKLPEAPKVPLDKPADQPGKAQREVGENNPRESEIPLG